MHTFGIIIAFVMIFIVNPLIAFFNAKNVGSIWSEVGNSSTWEKLVLISALVQSVAGFAMPSFGILLSLGYIFNILSNNQLFLAIDLMWISIIIPVIGTGIILTIQSIKEAIRERSFSNITVAVWNVGSTIENIIDLFSNMGGVIRDFGKRSDDEDDVGILVVISIVMISICSGFVLTGISFRYGQRIGLTYNS